MCFRNRHSPLHEKEHRTNHQRMCPRTGLPFRGHFRFADSSSNGLPRRDPRLKTPTLEPACLFAALPHRSADHHIANLFRSFPIRIPPDNLAPKRPNVTQSPRP
jgi:hypothetical protein